MALHLTQEDQEMLNGQRGPAAQLAMRIMARMGDILGAPELKDISQAHIDGCALMSTTGLEFAERMAALGAKTAVPTTLNMIPLDLRNWQKLGIPADFAARALRMARAYEDMGCIPTWTCAPYQGFLTPRFGQQIAWGESNAIVYANSVLGARTERYADFLDLCAAVTGRVPKYGLHLDENRRGQVLIRLVGFDPRQFAEETFYPALGFLVGRIAQKRIPVIDGLAARVTSDQFKAFGAAAASSGAIGLFHMVGLTPEAGTLEDAFQGHAPERRVDLRPEDVLAAQRELTTLEDGEQPLDAVVLGCPHFSYAEFRQLAEALEELEHPLHPGVRFVVVTSQASYALLERSHALETLNRFGVEIIFDTCVFHSPILQQGTGLVMTNSGKCAYYAPGELNARVGFGSIEDCVRSAAAGKVVPPDSRVRAAPALKDFSAGEDVLAPEFTANLPRVGRRMRGRALVSGSAEGQALVSRQPISFWGGVNPQTGEVIDRRHDCAGAQLAGKIFVFPTGKGSSTGSAVLLEALHNGVAPAAIINSKADAILALGVVIAETFFHQTIPVVELAPGEFDRIQDGDHLKITPDGSVVITAGETTLAGGED
jgi:predicted aconitase/predicted aconitase with swiveling domain